MTDPTDDNVYKGLTLTDYLRHFVPQVKEQQQDIKQINEAGFKPFYDDAFPETRPKPPPPANRQERRQQELKQRKLDKKIARNAAKYTP